MSNQKSIVWIIGDSTVSSFSDKFYYPRYGWGTQLANYIDDKYEVKNIALSGRSSKSYTAEPQYDELCRGMKKGDYLLIGFGHNDEKTEAGRYTNPNGDYTQTGSFANSLYENYVKKAQEAGCRVILCTPIVRRTDNGKWKNEQLHITETIDGFEGGDYSQAIRKFGRELSIPVVDMTALTKELYDNMGYEKTIYFHAWPSDKSASVDNTHTNIWGAKYNAYIIANEISGMEEELAKHIRGLELPLKEKCLVSNEAYIPTVYNSNLPQSKLWSACGKWQGTAFGDIGGQPTKDKFVLEPMGENIHIAVINNAGKISAVTDGIAMYYQKIPSDKNFRLTAKATINSYFLNDQVSFGLMARDDMYIDNVSGDMLGDYVAAGLLKLTNGERAWNCFARKSGVLTQGGTCTRKYKEGDVVELAIESTDDGYACTFGSEATITGGFDFKLTSIDADNVYVGMYVSRNADITFSDIKLEIK